MTSLIPPYIHSTCIYQCLLYARHCPSHWGTAQVTSLGASFICYTNFLSACSSCKRGNEHKNPCPPRPHSSPVT